ncbi:hypothetical protein EON65_08015 [archaeon]|nr:MAG: hypothetical protein EON65_08015 [archaeon]
MILSLFIPIMLCISGNSFVNKGYRSSWLRSYLKNSARMLQSTVSDAPNPESNTSSPRISPKKRYIPTKGNEYKPEDPGYELLDFGMGQKLEKFGPHLVVRPSLGVQHAQRTQKLLKFWRNSANLVYSGTSGQPGMWNGTVRDDWKVQFGHMTFHLNTSSMGQVGVFPEQQCNWEWMQQILPTYLLQEPGPVKVLNGFAYTGGSTMACLVDPRIQVTHLEASKSFVKIATDNVQHSACQGSVRWVIDDVMTFLYREIKRGNKYNAVIFDPPAFGRFERMMWSIEKDFPLLIEAIPELLCDNPAFVLLSAHDRKWDRIRMKDTLEAALAPKFGGGVFKRGLMSLLNIDDKKVTFGEFVRWTPSVKQ